MGGDRFIRSMLVLSGLSPVFLLWAIRGVQSVPSNLWAGICLMLFVIPNAILKTVIWKAKREDNKKVVIPTEVRLHQEQLLIYLLAMLLPLIEVNFNGWRDALAGFVSLTFTAFLFYKMKLHYMNLAFLLAGYSLFEVRTGEVRDTHFVVISKRRPSADSPLTGYRLGGNVLMEIPNDREHVQIRSDKDSRICSSDEG